MRQRTQYSRYQYSSPITHHYRRYSVSTGDLLYEYLEEIYPGGSHPTRWSSMEDELGFSQAQAVFHRTRKFESTKYISTYSEYLEGSDWRIVNVSYGDALSWFYYSGGDLAASGYSEVAWEPVDGSRLNLLDGDVSQHAFYGLETAKDVFHLILAAKKLNVKKSIRAAQAILKRFRIRPSSTLHGVKRALSATSNGFLAYSFGVKPLVDDVASIGSAYDVYRSQLQKMHMPPEAYKKTSRAYETSYAVPQASWPLLGAANGVVAMLTAANSVSRITAQVKASQSAPAKGLLSYLHRHLKLGDIVGLGWELIPFSFAADWFLHIDKRIATSQSYLEKQYADPALVRTMNTSQRRVMLYEVKLYTVHDFSLDFGTAAYDLGTVSQTVYLRNVPSLKGLDLVSLTGFNSFQRRITAAIVWQWVSGMLGKSK